MQKKESIKESYSLYMSNLNLKVTRHMIEQAF
jgi:hypothetical protein